MRATDPCRRSARLGSASLASILVLTFAAGCGSSGPSTTTATKPNITSLNDLLVKGRDVQAAGEGSPSAVLLGWWRALQLQDTRVAERAYAKSVDTGGPGPRPSVQSEMEALAYSLEHSRPEILDVASTGRRARVSTVVNSAVFGGGGKVTFIRQTPVSFELKLEGGEWKLANDDYLLQALEAQVAESQ